LLFEGHFTPSSISIRTAINIAMRLSFFIGADSPQDGGVRATHNAPNGWIGRFKFRPRPPHDPLTDRAAPHRPVVVYQHADGRAVGLRFFLYYSHDLLVYLVH
jgi:hypothetical protein